MDPFIEAAIEEAREGKRRRHSHQLRDCASGTYHRPRSQSPRAAGQRDSPRRDGCPRKCWTAAGLCLPRVRAVHDPVALLHVLRAILLYRIPRVIVGENRTFLGEEELLRSRGVKVEVLQHPACISLMEEFIAAHPELWNEDIGIEETRKHRTGGVS
jgi:cytosine/creatinine deaminase